MSMYVVAVVAAAAVVADVTLAMIAAVSLSNGFNRKSTNIRTEEKRPEPDLDGFRVQKFGPKKRPESEQSETTRT